MTKRFSFSKKIILCLLAFFVALSVSFAILFRNNTSKADYATGAELRQLFLDYLAENGITSEADIIKAQTNKITNASGKTYTRAFIDTYTASGNDLFGILYEVNGRSTDMITEEGAKIIQECFGIDVETFLMEGGSVDNGYVAKHTKKFVEYKDGFVKAGGSTVNPSQDFSLVIMGDQQSAVEYASEYVAKSYNWIKDNASAMNLKAFINVGDIVDDARFLSWRIPSGNPNKYVNYNPGHMPNWSYQLQFAENQANKLMDLNIPIAMTMGNHDYDDMAESYRVKDSFNEYFDYEDYAEKSWFGESLYNDLEACTYYFDAFGVEYMIITLGTYPTDEMLDWANQMVEANPNKKVIVSTHGYYEGESRELTDYGFRIWNNFLKKHANILMVVCGHECTEDGSVIKRIDFGDNGNAVYQFMINPQVEEFYGSGMFSQFIFRADGSVDHVYYSPYVDECNGKGYFLDVNQFSFNLDVAPMNVVGAESFIGNELNVVSADLSYLGNENSMMWQNNVYSLYNVVATNRGLTTPSNGYVIHKLNASEKSVFTSGKITVSGKFTSENGEYQIEVSHNGVDWKIATYNSYKLGYMNNLFNITDDVVGAEELYIKISFADALLVKTIFEGSEVLTVVDTADKSYNYTYPNSLNTSNYKAWDMANAYAKYNAVLSGGRLGSGDPGKLSYKSSVSYRYESGFVGRTFDGLSITASMNVIDPARDSEGHQFYEEDTKYFLRYAISIDGGKTYEIVKEHLFTELSYTNYVATPTITDDLSSYLVGKNASSLIIRVEYFGAGATFCHTGINSLNFNVSLTSDYINPEIVYDLNGGYINDYIDEPQKDGYVFEGWHLGTVDGEKVNPADYEDLGVTLVAKWLKVNSVTYLLAGGQNNLENVKYIVEGETFELLDATKDGKTFLGWFTADKQKVETITGGTEDIVLYAYWL